VKTQDGTDVCGAASAVADVSCGGILVNNDNRMHNVLPGLNSTERMTVGLSVA